MSTQNTQKKVLFNIKWDLDTTGVRQLELDAIKCLNSNINAVNTFSSPIDGTTTKTNPTLFFARTRLINLIDIWNRIVNSGLFITYTGSDGGVYTTYKIVGANLRTFAEYPFRNFIGSVSNSPDFSTTFIFSKLIPFITASVNNFNWYKTNSVGKQSFFALSTIGSVKEFSSFINTSYNPDNALFIGLMNELITIVKDLINESKLSSLLAFNFDGMDFGTTQGRTNLLALDAYKSNYKALAKIEQVDLAYLNDETKALVQEWISTNGAGGINVQKLYPQFATTILRNTETEAWAFRNVVIDTTDVAASWASGHNPELYQTKYIACTQLDMKKPLVLGQSQFINWPNPLDRPYVMVYNGGTLVYIPDQLKEQVRPGSLGTLGEQPDNQMNLSAYFWKIGTAVETDPNYNENDDIKLKFGSPGNPLYSIDKIDFLDNLTIYLKMN